MCEICHQIPCHIRCPNYNPKPIYKCKMCNEEIYIDDEYYEYDGEQFCSTECATEWLLKQNFIERKICDESF